MLTEQNDWIFIGSLRPGRLCSILARGGHTIKKESSAGLVVPWLHREAITAKKQEDGGGLAVDT